MQSAPSGAAVSVRDAYKYYGSSKKPKVVLDRLTMTVPKGEMSVHCSHYFQLSLIKCGVVDFTIMICNKFFFFRIKNFVWSKNEFQALNSLAFHVFSQFLQLRAAGSERLRQNNTADLHRGTTKAQIWRSVDPGRKTRQPRKWRPRTQNWLHASGMSKVYNYSRQGNK